MKIVNLGSSFAAGPGISPVIDKRARRSARNYAHLLAEDLDAELLDLSVSGATLKNMYDEPQKVHGMTFVPQVQSVPPDANLVLVLGGGNDIGFSSNIIADTWLGWLLLQMLKLFHRRMPSSPVIVEEADLSLRYSSLLDSVHHRAPNAKVFVVGYLTVFGKDAKPGENVPFSAQRLEFHRSVASRLHAVTERAVSERHTWCQMIHSGHDSDEHGMGSRDPWVFGMGLGPLLRGEAWAHPNAEGHKAIYRMLRERISNGK